MTRRMMTLARNFGAAVFAAPLVAALLVAPAGSAALLSAGCGGDSKAESTSPSSDDASKTAGTSAGDGRAVSSTGKKWGGWRWKGKRDNCFYVHKNRCFDSKEKACKAARCKKNATCVTDKSAPAKVSCEK